MLPRAKRPAWPGDRHRRRWLTLLVLCISLIVITLDNISVARHAPAARPFTDQIIAASESFV